jgi:Tol biopolymer transport system component
VSCSTARPSANLPAHTNTIAFAKFSAEVENDIYSIQTDGTGLTKLAHEPGANLEHPAWSPDGTKIAFCSLSGNIRASTIWSMNADGSGKIRLTQPQMAGLFPTWSPNGKQIAFTGLAADSERFHIYTMNANGSNMVPVTSGDLMEVFPAWVSDGRILFIQEPRHVILGDVFAINPDGSGLVQLTKKGTLRGFALSPDGKNLAVYDYVFRSILKIPIPPRGDEVVLAETFRECDNMTLSWSPDGKVLAMACNTMDSTTGASALYIVNADGSGFKKVENAGLVFDPDWRPE